MDKTVPSPPGVAGINPNNPTQMRLVQETASNMEAMLRSNWQQAEARYKDLTDRYRPCMQLEEALAFSTEGPPRIRRTLGESLEVLAELFVNKYPKEDNEVVQNLVAFFVKPVQEKLEGNTDDTPSEPTG